MRPGPGGDPGEVAGEQREAAGPVASEQRGGGGGALRQAQLDLALTQRVGERERALLAEDERATAAGAAAERGDGGGQFTYVSCNMQATYHHLQALQQAGEDEGATTATPQAVSAACELIGDRWSLAILAALLEQPLRYTEIQELLPGLAPNILSARVRTLERDGLISAERYSARPPRFQYGLTATGRALRDALLALSAWGAARAPGTDARETGAQGQDEEQRWAAHEAPAHEHCGGALELRWWCPECAMPTTPQDRERTIEA